MRVRTIISGISTSALLIAGLAGGMAAAAPSTIYVSQTNCSNAGPGTQKSPYCTVQEGVNAAPAGGKVQVEDGTYTEQVLISGTSKNNLKITGNGDKTIIAAPAVMTSPKAIVQVSQATGVTLTDLTVSGPGGSGCDSLEYGIRVDTGGQANIKDDNITKIEDTPFSGCQNGVGIQVGRQAESTTGQANISDVNIDNYQKNGITVSNTGSSANISDTNVTGAGPTATIAQNGIEVAAGATVTVRDSNVKNNIYSPQTVASTGFLLFDSGTVKLSDNTANKNDVDMYLIGVKNSVLNDNITNNGTYNGIYVDSASSGNKLTDNSAHGTTGTGNFDMQDDSTGSGTLSTANTWHNNSCVTSSPAKLCKQ